MTAAASRAAYYPEMVRAAADSFTGLNLANAAKPRMSGYYRGDCVMSALLLDDIELYSGITC